MFGTAFSLALYVGNNVLYTAQSQAQLADSWSASHPTVNATASSDPALPVTFERPRLALGQPLARIVVPGIGWNGIVLEGTRADVLSGGPGHQLGTAYPGEPDNVVISNHNSYSLDWGKARAGDAIILQTNYGTYTYRITGFRVVEASDTSVAAPTGKPTLTFTTCYPLWAGAVATQRYIVRADLVQ